MNRIPVQLANAPAPFPPADLPDLSAAGLDTALASTSVRAAHGTPLLFARALAAGLAQDSAAATDRDRALDLVSVAAWRSGALGLRVDALDRLEHLDTPEQRLAAAATLGLGVDVLDEFRRRQRKDRFWWPGRADQRGYVLAVGGSAESGARGSGLPNASTLWRTPEPSRSSSRVRGGDSTATSGVRVSPCSPRRPARCIPATTG